MQKIKVCWLSAGVSSFIAGYLVRDTVDEFICIDIADQHPDSMRFIKDCEKALDKEVKILKSSEYNSVEDCVLTFGGFVNRKTFFAPCTNWLKKRVRKQWEYEHKDYDVTYVWGMDANEKNRAERLIDGMPEFTHEFPLIDTGLTKEEAHGICNQLGVKRPAMYDLGYNNNNCIGCIKGGIGYWNKIRLDFPEVFESRAKLERKVNNTILKDSDGTPIYLDELDPNKGRMSREIMGDCDIFCSITFQNLKER